VMLIRSSCPGVKIQPTAPTIENLLI